MLSDWIGALVGFGLFGAFTVGLALSIGEIPFILIVVVVLSMGLVDLVQTLRQRRRAGG